MAVVSVCLSVCLLSDAQCRCKELFFRRPSEMPALDRYPLSSFRTSLSSSGNYQNRAADVGRPWELGIASTLNRLRSGTLSQVLSPSRS